MDMFKHGGRSEVSPATDLGSYWPPSEGCFWMWVVSDHGSATLWQVRLLIGSEAGRRPDAGRHCPAASEKPGAERLGQDRVRLAVALYRFSNAIDTLLHSGQLRIASTQPWITTIKLRPPKDDTSLDYSVN